MLKENQEVMQFYFGKIILASTEIFIGFSSFYFAVAAEIFENVQNETTN